MGRIGILALQGGYGVHGEMVRRMGAEPVEIRTGPALDTVDGLILPGGESTTQLRLIHRFGLRDALDTFVASEKPILATCAGLILAARGVTAPEQTSYGWLDIDVSRNGWGRQVFSFEAEADPKSTESHFGFTPVPMLFIRAPRITRIGTEVEVLGTYREEPVLIRQGHFIGATFHPELTPDERVHRLAFSAL